MAAKRLYRSRSNRIVSGVLGGLGDYFNVDPTLLRLAWVVVTLFSGFVPGLLAYLVAIVIIPLRAE
ncbi:MAG: PspC domain-containing protein [candidate division FCPU426 bacterium]